MVEGKYSIIMKSPMGPKKGVLNVEVEGSSASGSIEVLGKSNPFADGKVEGERISFAGSLQTSIGKLAYEIEASVDGDRIEGEAKSPKGTMKIAGTRL
jgi:hypothetical protein